ncbi:AAA family ATPase [Thermus sediminis]|uniref:AAA family ATPase n=1 Tax=Thermus sediminis TaxID=1761908 RepID=UPI000E3C13CD|nr:SMC family ATPase [Thermus sediminis]
MRPLRLELEGFGPYRERQGVDFSDVELFAITGPTGSGKSTLLDAMAFALYGLVPRVGRNVKELVHPGVGEARVRLTFQVGGRLYRVDRVRGKRSEGRLFDLTEGERLIPLETLDRLNEAIEEILGLSYEAFTRALLLPQGEFDRFLKGEARERRDLLLDLFGLRRLDRAREKAAEARARLLEDRGRLEGELSALAEATPEALADHEERLAALREELARLEGEVSRLEARRKEAEEALEGLRRKALLQARQARLLAEAQEVEEIRRRLALGEEAERALPLWEDLRRKGEALAATQARLREAEGRLKGLEEALRALAFDPEALKRARKALLEVQELKALEALFRRVGLEDHPAPRFAPERLEEVLAEEAEVEGTLQALLRLKEREKTLGEARERLSGLEKEGRAQREEVDRLRRLLEGALAHRLLEEKARLEAELAQVQEEEALAQGELQATEARLGLLAYHPLLKVGEACPLCGGVVHALPERPSSDDLEARKEELGGRVKELVERRASLLAGLKALEERLGALEAEPVPGDPEALERALKEGEEALGSLREAFLELRGQVQALEREVAALRREAGEARLEDVAGRLNRLREEKAALSAGLYRHLQERTGGLGVAPYLRNLEEEVRVLEAKEKEERRLRQELEGLYREVFALKARESEQAKALQEAKARVEGLLPEEEARAHALAPEARRALEGRLRRHEEEVREVEALLRALPPLPPLTLLEAEAQAKEVRKALEEAQGRLRALGEEGAVLETRVRELREALRRRRELEARLAEAVREAALWEKLALDLKQDRFPAYLLGLRQRSLVERADELLHTLSGGRYRFRAKGDEYGVLDLWTEAERPVKTLSGGESFLASLSLALALSEELSRGRLGALFLDEGFGTLDPEALEGVAGVLEALPTRGRLVGIVTHVEALAERLPARLLVRKHPLGSRVEWA